MFGHSLETIRILNNPKHCCEGNVSNVAIHISEELAERVNCENPQTLLCVDPHDAHDGFVPEWWLLAAGAQTILDPNSGLQDSVACRLC